MKKEPKILLFILSIWAMGYYIDSWIPWQGILNIDFRYIENRAAWGISIFPGIFSAAIVTLLFAQRSKYTLYLSLLNIAILPGLCYGILSLFYFNILIGCILVVFACFLTTGISTRWIPILSETNRATHIKHIVVIYLFILSVPTFYGYGILIEHFHLYRQPPPNVALDRNG